MLTKEAFDTLHDKASKCKYTYAFDHLDYDECQNAAVLSDNDDLIILINKIEVYWATNDPDMLLNALCSIPEKLYIEFIPPEYIEKFEQAGFYVYAEFVDFFNNNLRETQTGFTDYHAIEFANKDDIDTIRAMTTMSVDQTRGFRYETEQWYLDFLTDNDIIILQKDGVLIGYCCVSVYANGTILWVRRIAVHPDYQGKGYGGQLMERAFTYGIHKGAHRAFLHADIQNTSGIRLYNRYGFAAQSERGEIIMIREENPPSTST